MLKRARPAWQALVRRGLAYESLEQHPYPTKSPSPPHVLLAKEQGLQLKRALTFVVQEYNYEGLMAGPRIRAESKAAVAACGAPAAGAFKFLSTLPRKPELKLDETS